MPSYFWIAASLLAAVASRFSPAEAGNTTCIGPHLDWYTSVVGETPCVTYEKLRRICNSDYEVPNFRPLTPGDNCDDQLSSCCCNSISWALSMLCMNCQQVINSPGGIDAGAGAYLLYRTGPDRVCAPARNMTLSNDIQRAVCNANVRLDNFLYGLFWNAGDWFYAFTKATAVKEHLEKNNDTFTRCPNQVVQTTTASSSSTSTDFATSSAEPQVARSSSAASIGRWIGIGLAIAIVTGLSMWAWYWRWRRRRADVMRMSKVDLTTEYAIAPTHDPSGPPPMMYAATPGTSSSQPSSTSNLLSGRAHRKKEVAAGMPLPQSPPPPLAPSFNAEPERHQDAGPVVLLTRADSERLPPAYLSWATNEPASGPSQPPQGQEQQTADAPRGESKRAKFRARNRLQ